MLHNMWKHPGISVMKTLQFKREKTTKSINGCTQDIKSSFVNTQAQEYEGQPGSREAK